MHVRLRHNRSQMELSYDPSIEIWSDPLREITDFVAIFPKTFSGVRL